MAESSPPVRTGCDGRGLYVLGCIDESGQKKDTSRAHSIFWFCRRAPVYVPHWQPLLHLLTKSTTSIMQSMLIRCRYHKVNHPTVKLLVIVSQVQESEMGDSTNMIIILAT
ncbi:hypothetical protein DFJ58DRAFT_846250 [Suillus subalutaceus]|uniref:uncharacterized protein n=1 Tax=Suillus subalutaceus TaxID=48586 RepID=UPI001B885122|nr:uncharacterized protein DFJ58DRAFT_846250 [Suillus subalutaceus]KAG1837966.1 hypothetical protein DFJ58DRAFT_846250 [Suillus subalutaceus]